MIESCHQSRFAIIRCAAAQKFSFAVAFGDDDTGVCSAAQCGIELLIIAGLSCYYCAYPLALVS
ncbi:hypothetical protein KCP71_16660 [Salmonella enterica subsp. enterica]|nr:hypothetical protein KCP71_16660 [Salmonella enterica subsp. enterica]